MDCSNLEVPLALDPLLGPQLLPLLGCAKSTIQHTQVDHHTVLGPMDNQTSVDLLRQEERDGHGLLVLDQGHRVSLQPR